MENTIPSQEEEVNKVYNYAANLMINEGKSAFEAKESLVNMGLSDEDANTVVENLDEQIYEAKRSQSKKDMIYGALWCVGGLIGTFSNTGFIFWGAIVFGGFQFFKGVMNYSS